MLKKFYKLFILLLLINISFFSYSEVKEIITVEEYSKQLLSEDSVLDNEKKEQDILSDETQNQDIIVENEIKENDLELKEQNLIETQEVETNEIKEEVKNDFVQEQEIKDIKTEDTVQIDSQEIKELEVEEEEISEEEYKKEMAEMEKKEEKPNKKNNTGKINWDLPDNFRAVLIGDTNGNIYYSKNADESYPLASVTKVMSLMVTFDEIKAGRVSLKDKVKITKDVAHYGGSGIPLKAGQVYKLEDLVKASAIYSANNATYALAKYVGSGSVWKFVTMMNKKAEKLGLHKDIKYYTPAGLPTRMTKKPMDSGTARAIYKLSIEALNYKKYIEIAGIKNTTIYSGKVKIKNRNHLIGEEGIYGIKTGFHKEAKYNITVATKIDGLNLIVVVMGGETYKERDKIVLDLIQIFKENYYIANILDKTKPIGKVKVNGTNIQADVVPDKNYKIALKNSQKYRVEIIQRENIKLNIFKGEDLGEYQVYVDDKLVLKGRLLAHKAINE